MPPPDAYGLTTHPPILAPQIGCALKSCPRPGAAAQRLQTVQTGGLHLHTKEQESPVSGKAKRKGALCESNYR